LVSGPHAVVQGTLEFRREVGLKGSDSAQIGPIKGATPVKFSGATP
jgi:outer membrane lipoprotein SlyB